MGVAMIALKEQQAEHTASVDKGPPLTKRGILHI